MQKVLFAAIVLVLHSVFFGSFLLAGESYSEPQKLKYEYRVETDLPASEFSDVFCERLSTKHKWQKLGTTVSRDETFTSTFRFRDENAHSWNCEVTISKDKSRTGSMNVIMIMDPRLES